MKVLYIQPYIPAYRIPLFNELAHQLKIYHGGLLTVAHAVPTRDMAARRDAASPNWSLPVPGFHLPLLGGSFYYRRRLSDKIAQSDVCVMELDVGNLNAWRHVSFPPKNRTPIVLWGHGKSYTSTFRAIVAAGRRFLAQGCAHVMTYTERGRQSLIDNRIPASHVTSVGNATDTVLLRHEITQRLTRPMGYSEAFDTITKSRRTYMYVGALDPSKRVDFLLEVANEASKMDPRFLLLVAGSGPDEHLVRSRISDHVRWIPRAAAPELADMFVNSEAVVMPGRVGLVAVDCLAAGVPIYTTNYPYHAPEIDFLTPGRDYWMFANSPKLFAQSMLTCRPPRINSEAQVIPTVQSVADAMLQVIQQVSGSRKTSL